MIKLLALAFNPPAEVAAEIKKTEEAVTEKSKAIRNNRQVHKESIGVVKQLCQAEIELAINKRDEKIEELEASFATSNAELKKELETTRENGVMSIQAAARAAKVQKLQARLDALRQRERSNDMASWATVVA